VPDLPQRGTSACDNQSRLPLEQIDAAVLHTLAGGVLRPAVVSAVIHGVLRELTPSPATELPALRTSLLSIERGLGNLAQAIATAGDIAPLLRELQTATAKRDDLMTRIEGLERLDV